MPDSSSRIVLAALALAAVLAGGCLTGKPPATPSPSIVFTSCKDLDHLVSRAAASAGCVVESKGPWGSESSRGAYRHQVAGLRSTLRCDGETAEKVLRALKAEVQTLAGQKGAEVIDTGEEEDAEGRLAGFEINYGAGGAHGKIEGKLQPAPVAADKPEEKRYEL